MVAFLAVVVLISYHFLNSFEKEVPAVKNNTKTIEITSDNLKNGVWDTIITKTSYGQNLSPALKFDKVDNAGCYAVYMIDPDGHNWLHWKYISYSNEIGLGFDKVSYVGPYPPSGTHNYNVKVYALKTVPAELPGTLDMSGADEESIKKTLANYVILAEGSISGTYTSGTK